MNIDLQGHFHAHITYTQATEKKLEISGWKDTIIVINKDDRYQEDVMITRHYVVPSLKTPELIDVAIDLGRTCHMLKEQGVTIIRSKLEHESLPTYEPSKSTYRECHIKIKAQKGYQVLAPQGFVVSRNAMDKEGEVYFLNARFYEGTIEEISVKISEAVNFLKYMNHLLTVLEVKEETTVFDSNLALDHWWA